MRRLVRLIFCLPLLALLAGLSTPAAAAIEVLGIRVGVHPDKTRIVLDLSGSTAYRTLLLANPYRLVVDLDGVEWHLGAEGTPKGRGLVAALRFGPFTPSTQRLVVDLAGPAALQQAAIIPGTGEAAARLVLDLVPTSSSQFQAGATTQSGAPVASLPAPPIAPSPDADPASTSANGQIASDPTAGDPAAGDPGTPIPPVKPVSGATTSSPPSPSPVTMIAALGFPPPIKPTPPGQAVRPLIMLDPGHGGVDPGTIGVSGIFEKTITLAMAQELKRQLEATGRYRVQLTRDGDVFVPLRDRIVMARAAHAELFISLHADSEDDASHRGATVYTLSETASDAEAAALAAKENKADLIAGVDLSQENEVVTSILIDLAQRETKNQSVRLADYVAREMTDVTLLNRNTHRFAGFAVLKAPDVPSILIELGYLSNAQDEKLLRTNAYRRKLGASITKAIDDYFHWQQSLTQG